MEGLAGGLTLDHNRLAGIFGVTVTPFTEDGAAVDEAGVERLVGALVADGVDRLVACGNTGEYHTLTGPERRLVARRTVAAAGGRALVIIGVGGALQDAIADARHAVEVGADAVMVHHPAAPQITAEGLLAYYGAIVAATQVRIIPYLRAPVLDDDGLRRLVELPGVVAVKYAVNDLPAFAHAVAITRGHSQVRWLCGTAESWAPFFWAAGAVGFTSGLVNVTANASRRLLAALEAADRDAAMAAWALIEPFERMRTRSLDGYNVAVVKAAMALSGRPVGPVRPPASAVVEADLPAILDSLARLSALELAPAVAAR